MKRIGKVGSSSFFKHPGTSPMVYHAYILRSLSTGRFYVGHTENLTKRVCEHNNNRTLSIKNRGPWELVHDGEFATRSEATQRELQIKKMKSHKWIERLARTSLAGG